MLSDYHHNLLTKNFNNIVIMIVLSLSYSLIIFKHLNDDEVDVVSLFYFSSPMFPFNVNRAGGWSKE
jgi:hypothetical protein